MDPVTGQRILLIFDPVRDVKNVGLVQQLPVQKTARMPSNDFQLANWMYCSFPTYNWPVKPGHVSEESPSSDSSCTTAKKHRENIRQAVFSESTRDALQFYAVNENKPDWDAIADFISLILKLWNAMNVKSRTKDKHKRDFTIRIQSVHH